MNIRFGSYKMRGRTTMCNSKHDYRENEGMHPALYNRLAQKITACTAVNYLICCHAYSKT
jgi:hypothetical protein